MCAVNGKAGRDVVGQGLAAVAAKFKDTLSAGGTFGVIGSNHTSNEENFYLQEVSRARF